MVQWQYVQSKFPSSYTALLTYFKIRTGARLGQGTGFDDLEWGILSELGIVDDKTVVATTVHDNQVLDMLPPYIFQNHDVPVDIICTPAQTSKMFNFYVIRK